MLAKLSWAELGGDHIWLPYAQMKTAPEPLLVESALGSIITLADGRALVDGAASWWTACHGYSHPHIIAAARAQLERMPHMMFGGLNHIPALSLAKRLAALLPGDLSRVFFSDSGSVSVEVAMKMALQYWLNRGALDRTKFVSFRNGYHGDTIATMSVCDPDEGIHKRFGRFLPQQYIATLPQTAQDMQALQTLLEMERDSIAAIVMEPLVQGVGGMKFHPPELLADIAALCQRTGHLLILDEVMTGFGRTGTMFACEQAGVTPDIICLSKALTGGTVGLAATVATTRVFEAFWSDDPMKALMHGPTFMANAFACSAANASLDLFESEPRLRQVAAIETAMREGLESCRGLPGVVDVRVKGAIGVVQLEALKDAAWLRQQLLAQDVWVRVYAYGDVVYLTPAFTIAPAELGQLLEAVNIVIHDWSRKFS